MIEGQKERDSQGRRISCMLLMEVGKKESNCVRKLVGDLLMKDTTPSSSGHYKQKKKFKFIG